MIKKILAAIIWFFAMFCELFILALIKLNVENKYYLCILPLFLNLIAIFLATNLWSTSFNYGQSKLSLQDKRRRIILKNMPLYLNTVCFFPCAFLYLVKRKDLDSRQRKSLLISACLTMAWLVLVYITL